VRYYQVSLKANDSTELFVRQFAPRESERPRRTLLIVHGTSEHGGRYRHAAQEAVSRGWEVIVPDLRGHGKSRGVPVHVNNFEQYLQDLDTLFQFFELNPDRTAIMAHSFGGLISARYAQTRPTRIAALVLLSPLLGLRVKINPLSYLIGKCMTFVAPRTRFSSTVPVEFTTRNERVLRHREQDKLIHRSVTASWFFEMKSALEAVWEEAPEIIVPMLTLQSGDDLIVEPSAAAPWVGKTSSSDRSFRLLNGHYHELLNEPDWRETLAHVLSWLETRLPRVMATTER
jgi:lysophospholipase